jgi:hypothetical protein
LTPQALLEARAASEEVGLGLPGHPISLYTRLLGKPTKTTIREDGDSYSRRIDYYQVPSSRTDGLRRSVT